MKKYSKLISQVLSMVMFFAIIICVSGTTVYDKQRVNAETIATKLFEQDLNPVEQVVYSHDLKSLDGESDYILVTGQEKGYVIFTREDMQIVEYSAEGKSPFGNINKADSYYGGPSNYFTEKDGEMEHIHTKEKIEKKHLKEISDKVREKTKKKDDKAKEKNKEIKETDNVKTNEVTAKSIASPNLNISLLSADPGPTGTGIGGQGPVKSNEYEVIIRKYIPNAKYFFQKPYHSKNGGTECTIVATQLILSYNNWINDGRLIPSQFLLGTEEERKFLYSKKGLSSNDDFFAVLRTYMGDTSDGISLRTAKRAIKNYLEDYTLSEVEQSVELNFYSINAISTIKNNIDHGYPIIVGVTNYKTNENGVIESNGHSIVVYGYQTFRINGNNVEGCIAHYGWATISEETQYDTIYNNVWVNSDWVDDCLSFTTSHQHTNETPITLSGNSTHITQCEDCKRYKANDNHTTQYYERIRNADEETSNAYDPIYHHNVCFCGYKSTSFHNFTEYTTYSAQWHYKNCSQCGQDELELHMSKYGDKCIACQEILINL